MAGFYLRDPRKHDLADSILVDMEQKMGNGTLCIPADMVNVARALSIPCQSGRLAAFPYRHTPADNVCALAGSQDTSETILLPRPT